MTTSRLSNMQQQLFIIRAPSSVA